MSVIIHARGRPYGVLGGDTTKERKFTSEDVHFLQSVANILATAIERRQLEQELLDISGREQQRIGQDLHDGICQELAGLHFKVGSIARELPGAQGKIGEIMQSLCTTIEHARMLAHSPVQLESNGLMSALEELASTTEQLFKIRCYFRCHQASNAFQLGKHLGYGAPRAVIARARNTTNNAISSFMIY